MNSDSNYAYVMLLWHFVAIVVALDPSELILSFYTIYTKVQYTWDPV